MSKIAVIQLVNISNIERDIPESKSDNYEVQKERVLLHLSWMNIDYASMENEPPVITENNTPDVDIYEKWERSLLDVPSSTSL